MFFGVSQGVLLGFTLAHNLTYDVCLSSNARYEPISQNKAVPSSPPRSNFVKLTNGAARRDSAGIPKFDRASYITRVQGRSEGVPCSLLSSSNIEKGESRGRAR